MDLNIDIKDLKGQFQELLGKLSSSSSGANNSYEKSLSGVGIKGKFTQALQSVTNFLGKFSYNSETILGVDLTPHYIRLCQMQGSYGQWTLNNLASSCIESQFRNIDIHTNSDLYVENLKDLLQKHKIKTRNVAFSLPTSSSIIKVLSIPDMSEEDLAQAAALGSIWESMVTLDGAITEYSVYYKILRHNPVEEVAENAQEVPVVDTPAIQETPAEIVPAVESKATAIQLPALEVEGMQSTESVSIPEPANVAVAPESKANPTPETVADIPVAEPVMLVGPTMDVLFVATKLSDVYLYSDIIRRAGLNPILADVRCLALKHAFESEPKNLESVSEPYAFMEFGSDDNYIFVIDGNNTDIYNVFVSEDGKNNIIHNSEDLNLFKVLVKNYYDQAQQIIANHESTYNSGKINNIFVSSSSPLHVNDASSAPLIKSFVEEISLLLCDHKISECDFCDHIIVPEKFAEKVNAEGNISAWASTVGIASRKLDVFNYEKKSASIDKVNLLPTSEEDKKAKRVNILSTLGTIGVFIIALLQIGYSYSSIKGKNLYLSKEIKGMSHIESAYISKFSESKKLTIIMNRANYLDDIKESLPSNQTSILSAYRHITKVIPEGVWLQQIDYTLPNKVEITGSSVNDKNILNFVKELDAGREFQKIALKTMRLKKDGGQKGAALSPAGGAVKRFTLEGYLTDNSSSAEGIKILSNKVNKNGH